MCKYVRKTVCTINSFLYCHANVVGTTQFLQYYEKNCHITPHIRKYTIFYQGVTSDTIYKKHYCRCLISLSIIKYVNKETKDLNSMLLTSLNQ